MCIFRRLLLLVLAILPGICSAAPAADTATLQKRWLYVPTNLYVDDNVKKVDALLERAAKVGYNGVLFADYKTCFWWQLDSPKRWQANAQHLRETTRRLGMTLNVAVFPFGRSGSLLFHDVNLATGMPVRDAPLICRDRLLVPEQTVMIRNGSFEAHRDNKAAGFSFQDDPGSGSFIDTTVAKVGKASLRFTDVGKGNPHGHGRISQSIEVKPWQQYRIRAWMRTDHLSADQISIAVLAGNRALQQQYPMVQRGKNLEYASSAHDLTSDWVEQSVTFNSLDNTKVNLYLGLWGGKSGSIWWDDWRIDTVPTLNLLRRDSLPLAITGDDGTVYQEGADFEKVVDPDLGQKPWRGNYDTRHEAPAIRLTATSRIREGQRLRFSGYTASLVYDGQVDCSMNEPAVYAICKEEIIHAAEALQPDGYFMSHDEIRSGGWEPRETETFKTSGELFAANIRQCTAILNEVGGGKSQYVWSDMFDPNHNAHGGYYLVNNTLAESWQGLDPKVIVMKWGGGKIARPGLQFFADRGNPQMIAAFYDSDVAADHRMWSEAMAGINGIQGVMYTTWRNDYSQLEAFAKQWWQK